MLLTVQWRKQSGDYGCLSQLPSLSCHVPVWIWQFIIQSFSALCLLSISLSFYTTTLTSLWHVIHPHTQHSFFFFYLWKRFFASFTVLSGLWQRLPDNLFLVLANLMKNEWIIKHRDSDLFTFSSSLVVDYKLKLGNFHLMLLLADMLTASLRPQGQRGSIACHKTNSDEHSWTRLSVTEKASHCMVAMVFHVSGSRWEYFTRGGGFQGELEKVSCCKH